MLGEKYILDFLNNYKELFKTHCSELNTTNNLGKMFIIFESFKPLKSINKPYSIIVRSNNAYDKNEFKVLEKTLVEYTNTNLISFIQGITYLSPNLLAFIITKISDNKFRVNASYNGIIETTITLEYEIGEI